jgi:hypothetical protein
MKWTVVFRDVAGSALFVPIKDAENQDEAVRLARNDALQHFSADEINAATKVEVRPGHEGLDVGGLEKRFGPL